MVTWMYNNRLQAPKLARKCEIKHWYACGTDGQAVGVGHVIAKFSGIDRACDQIKYCWKTKKNTWPQWVEKLTRDTVRW